MPLMDIYEKEWCNELEALIYCFLSACPWAKSLHFSQLLNEHNGISKICIEK